MLDGFFTWMLKFFKMMVGVKVFNGDRCSLERGTLVVVDVRGVRVGEVWLRAKD